MRDNRIDSLVYRLISGQAIYLYKGIEIAFSPPGLKAYNTGELYWRSFVDEVKFNCWPTMDQSENVAIELGLWSEKEASKLVELEKKIENTKEAMYQNAVSGVDYTVLSKVLDKMKLEFESLLSKKHSCDYITVEGYADSIKNEIILKNSITVSQPLNWTQFRQVLSIVKNDEITELEYRQVVRHKTWLSYWATGKEKIFSNNLSDLNHEQRTICNFTRLYDNTYNSPECPSEEILDNPDLFDGWLIARKKTGDTKRNKAVIDKTVGSKAAHVFVVANDKLTPQMINNMNRSPRMAQKFIDNGKINGQQKKARA